jgi:hypothetical protein
MEKMRNRRNKKTKKEQIKRLFIEIIARLIYYTIISVFGVACVLLVFGTLGAIVELCTISKLYCICYFIVCGGIILRWLLKEVL